MTSQWPQNQYNKKKYFAEQYVDNSDSAIIAIDIDEIVVIYNQTAEDIMGIPADEVLGKQFCELQERKLGTQDSILLNTLRIGRPYSHVEANIETPLGVMNVMAFTTLVKDKNDNVIGGILSIRDVTGQKQLEEKVVKAEKFSVIGELAAGIAHEVRNPLTSIKGFLQLLAQRFPKTDQVQQYINIMLDEISRINYIISEFLLLARPTVPIKRTTGIHNTLDEIVLLTEGELYIKNIKLIKEYDHNCPTVKVDVEQIKQVFLNLVTNAIAAMPEKGSLTIRTVYDRFENAIRIYFSDTGIGIDHSIIDSIFDPFFTTKEEGTGLGLTVSYRIIENHGGKIEVQSRPGEGTSFIVTIPAYRQ
ncbi:two-component system sensor histidine kinase NtrB [Phosphitispora sp. TUW77]|uniref:two-component system sensor histidine kinase NtrB n=1 Tax=Phosphitispora sp. TUW77 TaxID=3152361 RepID=UPI003AB6BCC0